MCTGQASAHNEIKKREITNNKVRHLRMFSLALLVLIVAVHRH